MKQGVNRVTHWRTSRQWHPIWDKQPAAPGDAGRDACGTGEPPVPLETEHC